MHTSRHQLQVWKGPWALAALLLVPGLLLLGWSSGCAVANSPWADLPDDTGGVGPTGGGGTGQGGEAGGPAGGSAGAGGTSCPIDCTTLQAPICHVGACNEQYHQCQIVTMENGAICEDGQYCTVEETCTGGACSGGVPNTCGIEPDPCITIDCDETEDECTTTPVPPGGPCVPEDLCEVNGTCNAGQCNGTAKDCSGTAMPDDCHVPQCNSQNGNCEPVVGNEGDPCEDPNELCTVNMTCAAGVCQGGSPKDCSQLTQGCLMGVCEDTTGNCVQVSVPNGGLCDDLNPCTNGEICQSGTCSGGLPVTQCINGDNCCPGTCTPTNDTDCAILTLNVGTFGSDYSSSMGTRGYWFTAPVNFTIVGLRVPTDVGTDVQNIEVVRMNSAVPSFPTTSNDFVSLVYLHAVPGTSFITVNIPVQSGQIIGIMGARGTTTQHNSYSTVNPVASSIGGQPVNLTRFGFQFNLWSEQVHDVWTESGGSIARVEMQYHL